jgi:nicotinate-nucleotide adenylyltransferase
LEYASLAVIDRPGATYDLDGLNQHVPGLRQRMEIVEAPLIDLSATLLRSRFAAGGSIRFQTPDAVIAYMIANGLYR